MATINHGIRTISTNPQTARVYELMKRDGYVTRLTAMHYGIANVTARIAELRNLGVDVRCVEQRDANDRRYGRWSLRLATTDSAF